MRQIKDGRYTVTSEFTGYPKKRWVVRYLDRWVSSHPTRKEAQLVRHEMILEKENNSV